MDTVTVSPIEQDIIIQPAESSVVIQDTSAAVNIDPGELNVAIQPQENAVNVLTGATIINNYGSDTVAITAAENLGGHRIVTVEGFYASKDTATDKNKVLGMTTGAVSIGSEATVQVSGFIEESSWNWNVDLPVFLSTDGQLTQSAITSGFSLIVGKPRTATNMFISISEPIILI